MGKPLFSVSETVWHVSKRKRGVVQAAWQDGEQWRYYVYHSGWTWSVPQSALDSVLPVSRTTANQALSDGENPKMPQESFGDEK